MHKSWEWPKISHALHVNETFTWNQAVTEDCILKNCFTRRLIYKIEQMNYETFLIFCFFCSVLQLETLSHMREVEVWYD